MITTLNVPDGDACQLQCYLDNDCVSYNFGPSETSTGDGNVCELNNSTDKRHLKTRKNFIYEGSQVIIVLII